MNFDPATWLEAAWQLREEADLIGLGEPEAAATLEDMAHRFENEARAAEAANASRRSKGSP